MKLFQHIKASFGSKIFYRRIIQENTKSAFKYYTKLSLLLVLVTMTATAIFKAPEAARFTNKVAGELRASFPEGLVVTFKDGEVSVNKPEPIIIPITEGIKENLSEEEKGSIESLIVIDTKNALTPDLFMSQKTLLLLSKDFIAHYDNRGGIALKAVKSFPDFVVNQETLYKLLSYSKALPLLLVILFGVGTFFGLLFNVVVALFVATLFHLSTKLCGQKLSFVDSYKVSLYAITLPTILEIIVFNGFTPIPFLFSLLALLIAIIATKDYKYDVSEVVPH